MNRILLDAEARPRLFLWEGPLDPETLRILLSQKDWTIPDDLFSFWVATGGGDLFETETILGPKSSEELGDNLFTENDRLQKAGLPTDYMVFHMGLFLSAIRLRDGMYVRLDPRNFHELSEYSSMEDWYSSLIRSNYENDYDLPA
jgi:hypothetical protein